MSEKKRGALLVRCSAEERELIRAAAKRENRTIGSYILNVVMSRITHKEELLKKMPESLRRKLISEDSLDI